MQGEPEWQSCPRRRKYMQVKLIIIADDLTGALDSCVQFAKKGVKAAVLIDPGSNAEQALREISDAEAAAVNTASRHDRPEIAAEKTADIVRAAQKLGIPYLYKKTDSVLRGNVGAELGSVYEASGIRTLPFIPAFPKIGRTTRNGIQYLNGTPISETAVGKDPFDPVASSEIMKILQKQCGIPLHSLKTGQSCAGRDGICIYDAETDVQMEENGSVLEREDLLSVTAGCGGFSEVLADRLIESGRIQRVQESEQQSDADSMLVVCGSVTQNACDQLRNAISFGIPTLQLPEELLYADQSDSNVFADFAEKASENTEVCRVSVLHSVDLNAETADAVQMQKSQEDEEKPGIKPEDAKSKNVKENRTPMQADHTAKPENHAAKPENRIAKNTGIVTRMILERVNPDILCIFGGDTLLGIMKELGADVIYPEREILPGIVLGTALCGGRVQKIVTKAGSFGGTDVIRQIGEKLCIMN